MYQIWRLLVPWIWISRQNRLNLQMGVAGPIFEPHPSNLVRIRFYLSCKNAEIFVVIFQVVSNLAKISVSVPSISWGVLGLLNSKDPWNVLCLFSAPIRNMIRNLRPLRILNQVANLSVWNIITVVAVFKPALQLNPRCN